MSSIAAVTLTICRLMGVEPPRLSSAEALQRVLGEARAKGIEGRIRKAFIYAPDALGEGIYRDYAPLYRHIKELAPVEVEMRSVLPTYTPVCFASMFTGAEPEVHGIRRYEKPVLGCDTLFDAVSRAGMRVAIVAVKDSSIDLIFRGRSIDYYTETYDPEVVRRSLRLLGEGVHDLIVAYNQEYDDAMHRSTPRSPEAIEAFKRHLEAFRVLGETFNEAYSAENRVIAFCPDHGTHVDPATRKGAHGTDAADDVDVRHFWGINRGG
jgi:hypothetical protein